MKNSFKIFRNDKLQQNLKLFSQKTMATDEQRGFFFIIGFDSFFAWKTRFCILNKENNESRYATDTKFELTFSNNR